MARCTLLNGEIRGAAGYTHDGPYQQVIAAGGANSQWVGSDGISRRKGRLPSVTGELDLPLAEHHQQPGGGSASQGRRHGEPALPRYTRSPCPDGTCAGDL